MKKAWSITTTMRNPLRLRDFLSVLSDLDGMIWDTDAQVEFQIRLIKERLYGYGKSQFYNNLTPRQVSLINDVNREITFEEAEEIFYSKNYNDPPHRGRESFNPIKKFGFAAVSNSGQVRTTALGRRLLQDDYDLQDVFLRVFLKWQIPNPDNERTFNTDDYNLKPFIGVLQLIHRVNQIEVSRSNKPKGISREEFNLFAPTLIHHKDIDTYAKAITDLRTKLASISGRHKRQYFERSKREFAAGFLNTTNSTEIRKLLSNLKDYGDNAIRYFRLTSYIHIRGNGYYIDLEPRRSVETKSLLETDKGEATYFASKAAHLTFISDPSLPALPWDSFESHVEIASGIVSEIRQYEHTLGLPTTEPIDYRALDEIDRKQSISSLRTRRQELQNRIQYKKLQDNQELKVCISTLEHIYDYEDRALLLEKTSAYGLFALNDAIKIQPQYPVGDDNEPTSTAPANTPDIECFYSTFNAICEVTMLTSREQWYYEGQPVMRHLRDFEESHPDKPAYCLFIAPRLHRDTVNTFWSSIKLGYEGQQQRILPVSIRQFSDVLNTIYKLRVANRFFLHTQLKELFDELLKQSTTTNDSTVWLDLIPYSITSWSQKLTG